MKNIIISGIDGSGKTSIINELRIELEKRGYKSNYIWLRMNHYLLKVMHGLARVFCLSVKVESERGLVYQHRFYKSNLFSWIYIRCCFFDTLISKLKLFFAGRKVDFLICDRWINDIVIDLGVKTHYVNSKHQDILDSSWFGLFQSLVPNNSVQFVIVRDLKDVIGCRLENREDPDFKLRFSLYEKLKEISCIYVVDNNDSIKQSVSQIVDILQKV